MGAAIKEAVAATARVAATAEVAVAATTDTTTMEVSDVTWFFFVSLVVI